MKTQNEMSLIALEKAFDPHFYSVLGATYLERTAKEKGKPARFKVLQPLPTAGAYAVMRTKRYTMSLSDVVEGAFSEVESLAEQMRSWYDNMHENLQGGMKGEEVNEAADTLENIQAVDVPDFENAGQIAVVALPALDVNSRSDRAGQAASELEAVSDVLEEAIDSKTATLVDGTVLTLTEEQIDDLEYFKGELQNAIDELQNVNFPGMY